MFSEVEFKHDERERVIYIIHHVKTRKAFVGISNTPNRRVYKHYRLLKNNRHPNLELQEAYNDSPNIYHVYYIAKEKDNLHELKKGLIDYYTKQKRSLNAGTNQQTNGTETTTQVMELAERSEEDYSIRLNSPSGVVSEKFVDLVMQEEIQLLGIEGLEVITEQVCFGSTIPGAYVIHHPETGQSYIGSTSNLYSRLLTHRNSLKKNKHANSCLQKAYIDSPTIKAVCFKAKDREHAYQIEQALLQANWDSGVLFNSSPDAKNALASFIYKGVVFTEEHRANMRKSRRKSTAGAPVRKVSIHGVVYPSVRDAARTLNLNFSSVQRWVNRDTEKYKDWFYVD